ncbi:hypothetical protein [Bradyrhizobium sp. HKCCYLRH1065]|uniref:hypothetical protein n=2 Tax=Nitrobacteraceae TaxID=41294 RepID=UPI003EBF73B3
MTTPAAQRRAHSSCDREMLERAVRPARRYADRRSPRNEATGRRVVRLIPMESFDQTGVDPVQARTNASDSQTPETMKHPSEKIRHKQAYGEIEEIAIHPTIDIEGRIVKTQGWPQPTKDHPGRKNSHFGQQYA